VLFVLRNERGEHRIPLSFDLEPGTSVGAGTIAAKASAALLRLITDALAGAPVRVVGGVTDVVGLGGILGGGDGAPKYAGMQASVAFEAGGVRIAPSQRERLADLVEAMDEDPLLELVGVHAFGPADLERAERLASPDTQEARTLLRSLRLRRSELVRRRDELLASLRARLALGEDEEFAAGREELVAVGRDLGLTEDGIDRVADLLRPGAAKRRDQRTRGTALAIARSRIDGLTRLLVESGVPFERLDLRSPRFERVLAPEEPDPRGRIELVTRGGTPPKGILRRILGWFGL